MGSGPVRAGLVEGNVGAGGPDGRREPDGSLHNSYMHECIYKLLCDSDPHCNAGKVHLNVDDGSGQPAMK